MSTILKGTLSAPGKIASGTGIAQDNIIFAMVLFAFVVWITTKGELPVYLSFFKPGASQGPPTNPVTASSTTGSVTSNVNETVASGIGQIGKVIAGAATGNTVGAVGGAIYNGVIQQPLNIIKSLGKSLGIM